MGQGAGIAGIILAVIAIFSTFPFNLFVIWAALICCAIAATSPKGSTLAVTTWIVSLVNIIFLSPLTLMFLSGAGDPGPWTSGRAWMGGLTFVGFILPIITGLARRAGGAGSPDSFAPPAAPTESISPLSDSPAPPSPVRSDYQPAYIPSPPSGGLSMRAFFQILIIIIVGALAADYVLNKDQSLVRQLIAAIPKAQSVPGQPSTSPPAPSEPAAVPTQTPPTPAQPVPTAPPQPSRQPDSATPEAGRPVPEVITHDDCLRLIAQAKKLHGPDWRRKWTDAKSLQACVGEIQEEEARDSGPAQRKSISPLGGTLRAALLREGRASWTASEADSVLSPVSVTAQESQGEFLFTVKGRYPAADGTGTYRGPATYINFWMSNTSKRNFIRFKEYDQTEYGQWPPGSEFSTTVKVPRRLLEQQQDLNMRLCMGATFGCFYSPNFTPQ